MAAKEIIEALKEELPKSAIYIKEVTQTSPTSYKVRLVTREDEGEEGEEDFYIGNFADPGFHIADCPPYQGQPMVEINGIYIQAIWKPIEAFIIGYPD